MLLLTREIRLKSLYRNKINLIFFFFFIYRGMIMTKRPRFVFFFFFKSTFCKEWCNRWQSIDDWHKLWFTEIYVSLRFSQQAVNTQFWWSGVSEGYLNAIYWNKMGLKKHIVYRFFFFFFFFFFWGGGGGASCAPSKSATGYGKILMEC